MKLNALSEIDFVIFWCASHRKATVATGPRYPSHPHQIARMTRSAIRAPDRDAILALRVAGEGGEGEPDAEDHEHDPHQYRQRRLVAVVHRLRPVRRRETSPAPQAARCGASQEHP